MAERPDEENDERAFTSADSRPLVKIELEVPSGVDLRVIINGVEMIIDD